MKTLCNLGKYHIASNIQGYFHKEQLLVGFYRSYVATIVVVYINDFKPNTKIASKSKRLSSINIYFNASFLWNMKICNFESISRHIQKPVRFYYVAFLRISDEAFCHIRSWFWMTKYQLMHLKLFSFYLKMKTKQYNIRRLFSTFIM